MRSSHTKGTEGMRIAGLRKASSVPPPLPRARRRRKAGGGAPSGSTGPSRGEHIKRDTGAKGGDGCCLLTQSFT
jgi:hypothetical protein